MVIDQGKPMLWVIVADPPCILMIRGPPTEKGIGLICSVVHSSGNRVWRRVKSEVARAVCGSSGSEL